MPFAFARYGLPGSRLGMRANPVYHEGDLALVLLMHRQD